MSSPARFWKAVVDTGKRLWLPLVACTLLALATIRVAAPVDKPGWILVFSGGFWLLPFAMNRDLPRLMLAAPVAFQLLLFLYCIDPGAMEAFTPIEVGTSIQDVRGGRSGMKVMRLRFQTSQGNAELLESYLGPLEPDWQHHCYFNPYIRDGNERVNIRSIIRSERLPEILNLLPHDQARKQVLTCATDPSNLLRVHQGLLLAALLTLGYPPGHDAESWWNAHEHLFRQEYNADKVVRTVWGWRVRLEEIAPSYSGIYPIQRHWEITRQSRAAKYQEQGAWGGNPELGPAFETFRKEIESSSENEGAFPQLGLHQVIWWPASAAHLE